MRQDLAHRKMVDARPSAPFISGDSMEFTMVMAHFDAATDSAYISSKDKLQELLHWFGGEPKKIVSNHYMSQDKDLALAMARSELESIYKENRDSFDSAVDRIVKGPQLSENDYNAHVSLYTKLREAQTIVSVSSNPNEFDRRDIIRRILNSRLIHLRTRFWREDKKSRDETGRDFGFDDFMRELNAWISILRAQGVDEEPEDEKKTQQKKPANIHNTSVTQQQRKKQYNSTAQSPPRAQHQLSDSFCPFCRGRHEVANCIELSNQHVDQRVKMLMEKNLCFHCFEPGHRAGSCKNKPRCDSCGGRHATLMHGRKFEERPARSNLSADSVPFRPFRQQNDTQQQAPAPASGANVEGTPAPTAPML